MVIVPTPPGSMCSQTSALLCLTASAKGGAEGEEAGKED